GPALRAASVVRAPGVEAGSLDPVAGRGRLGGRRLAVGLLDLLEDLLHRRRTDIDGKVLDRGEGGADMVHEPADSGLPSSEVHAFELPDGRLPQAPRILHP